MTTIWVTGAKGQLGAEIALQQSFLPEFRFIFTDIELDLRDKDTVGDFIKNQRPDFIINCAAYTAVDKAEEEEKLAFEINRDVPAILTTFAEKHSAILIHISTDYVFDGTAHKPYTEEDAPNPQSVYAKSKLAGEQEVLKGPGNIIIRTSWLYSAHGTNFIKTMLRLGREKEEIGVVDDQIGSPTWAKDLAATILTIINKISIFHKSFGGIYHYSNEGMCSWYDFAVEIMRLAKLSCEVNPLRTDQYLQPAKRPAYSVMDKSKIISDFSIIIPHWTISLEDCLMNELSLQSNDKK
jgi:dTDP-4-dehydrorhamnose reductase